MSDIYENFFIPVEGGPLRGNKGQLRESKGLFSVDLLLCGTGLWLCV